MRDDQVNNDGDVAVVADARDRLVHALIRRSAKDGWDPFMIAGHPNLSEEAQRGWIVRSCFYYTAMISPKAILLLDNAGAGGMCRMDVEEIRFIWKTPDVLAALGIDWETLANGDFESREDMVPDPAVDLWSADLKTLETEPEGPAPG